MITAETERLLLRPYRAEDVEPSYAYLSDPAVVRFEPYAPMTHAEVEQAVRDRMQSGEFLAVERKSDGKMIGNLYLGARPFNAVEIGYVFNPAFGGQGYATEACRKLTELLFAQGSHRVFAMCDALNDRSWKLLERAGFVREAYLKQNAYFWTDENGEPIWKDTLIYSRLK